MGEDGFAFDPTSPAYSPSSSRDRERSFGERPSHRKSGVSSGAVTPRDSPHPDMPRLSRRPSFVHSVDSADSSMMDTRAFEGAPAVSSGYTELTTAFPSAVGMFASALLPRRSSSVSPPEFSDLGHLGDLTLLTKVTVECGYDGRRFFGELILPDHAGPFAAWELRIHCQCGRPRCKQSPMAPPEFEQHAGRGHSKSWRQTIRVPDKSGKSNMKLGTWLEAWRAAKAPGLVPVSPGKRGSSFELPATPSENPCKCACACASASVRPAHATQQPLPTAAFEVRQTKPSRRFC